jgi:hypothetical protein
MTSAEAHANIAAYGFHRAEYLVRPGGGWSEIETSMGLPKRAAAVEGHLGKQVASAEFYPVFHGMLGYGHLFLFYDENNRLLEFYRVNIN